MSSSIILDSSIIAPSKGIRVTAIASKIIEGSKNTSPNTVRSSTSVNNPNKIAPMSNIIPSSNLDKTKMKIKTRMKLIKGGITLEKVEKVIYCLLFSPKRLNGKTLTND